MKEFNFNDEEDLHPALSMYLDGELGPAQKKLLEERLAWDEDAREMLGELLGVNAILSDSLGNPDAKRKKTRWMMVVIVILLLLGILVAWLLFRRH